MPATVTLDLREARALRCGRARREVPDLKAAAHRRERREVRAWLRGGDPDVPPVVRPLTGWEIA